MTKTGNQLSKVTDQTDGHPRSLRHDMNGLTIHFTRVKTNTKKYSHLSRTQDLGLKIIWLVNKKASDQKLKHGCYSGEHCTLKACGVNWALVIAHKNTNTPRRRDVKFVEILTTPTAGRGL